MGVHAAIYREREIHLDDQKEYKVKLVYGNREIKLTNNISIREEFYLGKSVWAINEWFYQYILKAYDKIIDEDYSYEWIDNEWINLDGLKELLHNINKVLSSPDLAEKILPMPKDLVLCKPKARCYDGEIDAYVTRSDDDWANVPRREMYDGYYFSSLKHAKKILEQLIREDGQDSYFNYIIDIG